MLSERPALLLDFDGLLVDSEPLHYEAFRRAFARFGHAVAREAYWLHFTHRGDGVEGEKRRHGLDAIPTETVLRDKKSIFSALCAMHPPAPRPGAVRLLRLLRELRWPYTIASNTDGEDLLAMLTHLETPAPPPLVGGGGLRPKPAPDIFLAAAEALGKNPNECLAVEDTLKGLRSAEAGGIRCVVVPGPQTAGFEFPGAWRILGSLDLLADELERLERSYKRRGDLES